AKTESILAGVPRSLPAVLEAYQLTRRAAHIGFDWDNLEGIFAKLDEEKREIVASLAHAAPQDVGARHAVPTSPCPPVFLYALCVESCDVWSECHNRNFTVAFY
ncbi:MAG: hypothetical protein WA608_22090, partial [Candidatus Acidiferrales bacterium]